MNIHANERNRDDDTPAYMNYDDGMNMNTIRNPQFIQDYSNHMYDIAHQYVNRHRDEHEAAAAAAEAEAEAAASAAKRVEGGRRRDNRGCNTRGHIKRRSRSRSRSRSRNRSRRSNKRMRRTRRM
jgi:hypothetical protein